VLAAAPATVAAFAPAFPAFARPALVVLGLDVAFRLLEQCLA
jgi:hypothetical protein